jgi:hypothetical protein
VYVRKRSRWLPFLLFGCAETVMLPGADPVSGAPSASLLAQLGPRVASLSALGGEKAHRYRVERYQPLLSEPYGNCHVVALRVGSGTLDVIHRWEHSGEYDLSAVPWHDILANKVRYSLSSMYGKPRQRQSPAEEATCPAKFVNSPATAEDALPPRCLRLPSGATLVGQGSALRLLATPRNILWSVELPPGHELIDFALHERLLFLATRSDQGARDGELQLPYKTTHIFAVQRPEFFGRLLGR